jgi:sec-independent protein translocase protein TatA
MLIEGLAGAPIGLFIGSLGTQELMIMWGIAVLIFGGRTIPEIFRGFGEGIREFKKSMKDADKAAAEKPEFNSPMKDEEQASAEKREEVHK